MKKILLAVVMFFFLLTPSGRINGQICKDLQADLDKADKKERHVIKKKDALQEFITLMEDPESGLNSLPEEITADEKQIKELQNKIAGGDKSPETTAELQALRTPTELMKLRLSNDFSENTFFKNPKYRNRDPIVMPIIFKKE